jgi:hypothetical protein
MRSRWVLLFVVMHIAGSQSLSRKICIRGQKCRRGLCPRQTFSRQEIAVPTETGLVVDLCILRRVLSLCRLYRGLHGRRAIPIGGELSFVEGQMRRSGGPQGLATRSSA